MICKLRDARGLTTEKHTLNLDSHPLSLCTPNPQERLPHRARPMAQHSAIARLLQVHPHGHRGVGHDDVESAELLDRVQGTAYEGYERTIDVHVRNLRAKIEPDPHQPRYIETEYGVGYRFVAEG